MKTKELTVTSVLEAVDRAVEKYGPDWVDPNALDATKTCQYVFQKDKTIRRCIVGEVLHDHGASDYKLRKFSGENTASASEIVEELGFVWSDGYNTQDDAALGIVAMVSVLQSAQDQGQRWGDVAKIAHHFVKNGKWCGPSYLTTGAIVDLVAELS